MHQPLIDAGRLAVKTLHQLIDDERHNRDGGAPPLVLVKPELVVRESSRGG
jgi:DNA-binding LacI/PurR family transcriptional regulator